MREDVLLLMGEGIFEGYNFINGQQFPVVKLTDGREVTVHQQGVYVGTKDSVVRTCATFPGVKIAFDIEAYINGKRPSNDDIARLSKSPSAKLAELPEPKTHTDKMMYLKREIELEENKKKMFQQQIEECDKKIATKRAEAAALKSAVIKELEDLDATPVAVKPEVTTVVTQEVAVQPTVPQYQPPPAGDAFAASAERAAIED